MHLKSNASRSVLLQSGAMCSIGILCEAVVVSLTMPLRARVKSYQKAEKCHSLNVLLNLIARTELAAFCVPFDNCTIVFIDGDLARLIPK